MGTHRACIYLNPVSVAITVTSCIAVLVARRLIVSISLLMCKHCSYSTHLQTFDSIISGKISVGIPSKTCQVSYRCYNVELYVKFCCHRKFSLLSSWFETSALPELEKVLWSCLLGSGNISTVCEASVRYDRHCLSSCNSCLCLACCCSWAEWKEQSELNCTNYKRSDHNVWRQVLSLTLQYIDHIDNSLISSEIGPFKSVQDIFQSSFSLHEDKIVLISSLFRRPKKIGRKSSVPCLIWRQIIVHMIVSTNNGLNYTQKSSHAKVLSHGADFPMSLGGVMVYQLKRDSENRLIANSQVTFARGCLWSIDL